MSENRPSRDILFEAGEAAGMIGAACRGNLSAPIRAVCADSRLCADGSLFVALPGEKADGSAFSLDALRRGASSILVGLEHKDRLSPLLVRNEFAKACVIYVDDPLAGLQRLAREHRRRHGGLKRIGVTGSSGKTTTKECIASILRASHGAESIVVSEGNLNSDIGLALSLFAIRPEHKLGVFEMGMNRRGEMGELAFMLDPDLGVITNVGTAHLGMIGSRRGLAEEKKKIFSLFSGTQSGFIWEDDDFRDFLKRDVAGTMYEFGPRSTPGFLGAASLGLGGWELEFPGWKAAFPLPGRHNLLDALAAVSVAQILGLEEDSLKSGLASVKPLFGRSQLFGGRISLLQDCYNANPESIRALLDLVDGLEWPGRKIYVLGSMRELGNESEAEHRALGHRAKSSAADRLFFFGEEMEGALGGWMEGEGGSRPAPFHTNDMTVLCDQVMAALEPGDLLVLKASRGLELERLSRAVFEAGWARPQDSVQGGTDAP